MAEELSIASRAVAPAPAPAPAPVSTSLEMATASPQPATASNSTTIREIGLTILHECETPKVDIVFIHGLQGHPRNTWTTKKGAGRKDKKHSGLMAQLLTLARKPSQDKGSKDHQQEPAREVFWPEDLLAPDYNDTRILTYGYESRVANFFSGPANQNGILQHGRDLLTSLAGCRRKADSTRPLIFVVHSLGGLILKEALCRARAEKDEDLELGDIYLSTHAIVFFGTPHRGGGENYVEWGLIATNVAVAAGFDANDRILRSLNADSEQLERLRDDFRRVLDDGRIYVHSFQESTGYKGVRGLRGKIVGPESSGIEHKCEKKGSINSNHMEMCRFSTRENEGYIKFTDVLDKILDSLAKLAKQQNEEEVRALKTSLYKIEVFYRQDEVADPFPRTYSWLWEEKPKFKQWLRSGSGIYWITGLPGSGKSTLMKYALNNELTAEVLQNSNAPMSPMKAGFFFHGRGLQDQKSFTGLLHSILYQIVDCAPNVAAAILPIYRQLHPDVSKREWTLPSLQRALQAIKTQDETPLRICLFIDALDEYDGKHLEIARFMRHLAYGGEESSKETSTEIKICLSSRPESIFTTLFDTCPGFKIQDYTAPDISRYVGSKLVDAYDATPHDTINAGLSHIEELTEYIVDNAHGVFLWVQIVVADATERLLKGDSLDEVRERLRETPTKDLNDLYRHIIENRIPRDKCLQAYKMLEIARCGSSMEVENFALFFDIANSPTASVPEYGTGELRDIQSYKRWQLHSKIQDWCRGLLVVKTRIQWSKSIDVVELLHGTLREYLKDPKNVECLFSTEPKPAENGYVYLMQGFLALIQQNRIAYSPGWDPVLLFGKWAQDAEKSVGDLANPILQQFGRRKQLMECWNLGVERRDYGISNVNTIEEFAATYNLCHFMEQRTREGFQCPRPCPLDATPLLHHALRDNRALRHSQNTDPWMVKLLLQAGADPNEKRGVHFPLLLAAFTSNSGETKDLNLEVLELLLQYGASANSEFSFRTGNPLYSFTSKRDPNEKRQRTYLLHMAVERRNIEMIELLFRHGALPNVRNLQDETPLSIAARLLLESPGQTGNDIVNKLLDHGALFTKETEPLLEELRQGLWYDDRWYLRKYRM